MLTVIGIDPGVTTGIAVLEYGNGLGDRPLVDRLRFYQTNKLATLWTVEHEILSAPTNLSDWTVVALEGYVRGRHGNSKADGEVVQDIVGAVESIARRHTATVERRNAALVKPWATDARLKRLGLLEATEGIKHARDACRHAIYAASKRGVPDPLSSRVGA